MLYTDLQDLHQQHLSLQWVLQPQAYRQQGLQRHLLQPAQLNNPQPAVHNQPARHNFLRPEVPNQPARRNFLRPEVHNQQAQQRGRQPWPRRLLHQVFKVINSQYNQHFTESEKTNVVKPKRICFC